ncbi:MAG TPA: hypothetical protein VKD67_14660 [Acidimicrobiales bacterium]|nr:hypothetical protein [Acidimicrobiales bacterium]
MSPRFSGRAPAGRAAVRPSRTGVLGSSSAQVEAAAAVVDDVVGRPGAS